jgi:23S rRNA U2552 (ribose-2'-O)-methylase RlmE/FtsJ
MIKKSLSIEVPKEFRVELEIEIHKTKILPLPIINIKENNYLKLYKNKIDFIPNNKNWDNYKKITNDYELIHMPTNKKKKNDSISFYNPLSRSYYKMIEILLDFNILNIFCNTKIKTAHIAEGPGGFIEALINKRRNYYDDINAITLKSTRKEIPGWKKARCFLERHPNISINYGVDGTGDIYNTQNIIHFQNKVGSNSCDLVTADGGFDFSIDFNKQEQLSSKLIFCEIVTALSVQKKGGVFICKFFDSYNNITIQFLWLLNNIYKKIIITKPFSSRPANSEKYIVAIDFLGINSIYLNKLYGIIEEWNIIESKGYYMESIFKNPINNKYLEIIEKYNIMNAYYQIKIIKETLSIINNNNNTIHENEISEKQIINALVWCNKYNLDINFASSLLQNNQYKDYFDSIKYMKWKNKFT